MYEFQRISYGKVKMTSDYFLFMCGAKNGQYKFNDIEAVFENPQFFTKPSRAEQRYFAMLSWLGQIIHRSGHTAEAWFQSVSLNNKTIFFNEFSASVLLMAVKCREALMSESEARELFNFICGPQGGMFDRQMFTFAFRRMRLTPDQMNKLNQTAVMISELNNFLRGYNTRFRVFRERMLQQQAQQEQKKRAAASPLRTQQLSPSSSDDRSAGPEDDTIGIAECETLLGIIFQFQGKKSGDPAFAAAPRIPGYSMDLGDGRNIRASSPSIMPIANFGSPTNGHERHHDHLLLSPEQRMALHQARPNTSPSPHEHDRQPHRSPHQLRQQVQRARGISTPPGGSFRKTIK